MPLTNIECKNAKPKDKQYKLSDAGGLYLLITPSGSKYWRLKYRFANKEKTLALGVYPTISLSEAREKQDKAKKLLASNIDPSLQKKKAKRLITINHENTLEAIGREWHQRNIKKWKPNHAAKIIERLEAKIFKDLGNFPVSEIEALDILDCLRKIEKTGSNDLAHRVLGYCYRIFQYAILTKRATKNPAADLKGALEPVILGHHAALEIDQLPGFLKQLKSNTARLYLQTRIAIELLMLTFVRTSELIYATWKEFNFEDKVWIIPAERMKMKRDHIVPLADQTIKLLNVLKQNYSEATKDDYIIRGLTGKKPISNNTILGGIKRLGYKHKTTGHGFRAMAMTIIKEKLGYRHEVVDRQLAHAPANKIIAAYDRAKFLDERKKMMQDYADYIDKVSISHIESQNAQNHTKTNIPLLFILD